MILLTKYVAKNFIGPWTIFVALGLDIFLAFAQHAPYRGDIVLTVDWFVHSLWIIWIVVAGAAATDAALISRARGVHLLLTGVRGRWLYLGVTALTGIPAAFGHTAVMLAAMLLGGASPFRVGAAVVALAMLVQALTVVWFAALGTFLGRFLPPIMAGAAGAAGGFIVGRALTNVMTERFTLFSVNGAGVPLIGTTWNPVHLWLSFGLMALTIIALSVRGASWRTAGVRPNAIAGVTLTITIILTALVPPLIPGKLSLMLRADPPTVCQGTDPVICVYPEHARYAKPLRSQLEALADAAQAAGYDALVTPRFEEQSYVYRSPAGTRGFWLIPGPDMSSSELVNALLQPAHCPQLYGDTPPGEVYWQNSFNLTKTWVSLVSPAEAQTNFPPEAQILSPQEVQRIIQEWDQCQLEG